MGYRYPLLMDVTGRTIVIIGGGKVAARKALGLIEAQAGRVRCVAPEFCAALPASVERIAEAYRPEHLDGAAIVFAATDRAEVNDTVVRDAHARNLLVNRADADEESPGDFTVPARLRRGEVVVTVSAGSPALSAYIRDRLEQSFDPRWQAMAQAMQELRPLIRSAGIRIEVRQTVFRDLATDAALSVLAGGGLPALRAWLLDRHPELKHA